MVELLSWGVMQILQKDYGNLFLSNQSNDFRLSTMYGANLLISYYCKMENVYQILNRTPLVCRLFYHECLRVFHDRLINLEDKTYFYHLMKEVCQRIFGTPVIMLPDTVPIREPPLLLFGDFMSQAAKEDRPYDEIKDIDKLKGILQVCCSTE